MNNLFWAREMIRAITHLLLNLSAAVDDLQARVDRLERPASTTEALLRIPDYRGSVTVLDDDDIQPGRD